LKDHAAGASESFNLVALGADICGDRNNQAIAEAELKATSRDQSTWCFFSNDNGDTVFLSKLSNHFCCAGAMPVHENSNAPVAGAAAESLRVDEDGSLSR